MSETGLRSHPAIFIPAMDYERLVAMAESAARREPDVATFLMQQLDRASTEERGAGDDSVRMQAHVRFRDEATGLVREVQLVYPQQADPASGRISILTPVGIALIGLSKGQSMTWKDRSGQPKSLTVLEVNNPSAPAA